MHGKYSKSSLMNDEPPVNMYVPIDFSEDFVLSIVFQFQTRYDLLHCVYLLRISMISRVAPYPRLLIRLSRTAREF